MAFVYLKFIRVPSNKIVPQILNETQTTSINESDSPFKIPKLSELKRTPIRK